MQSNKTFFMTVSTAAVVVCLPRTRHLSPPFISLSLSLFLPACLVCFSHFPQAMPSQAKCSRCIFSARNKIDPGKSRLEINLARPAQAAGGRWVVAVVWQVNQPKKSQEPGDSCLAPLPRLALASFLPCLMRPQSKYVLSLLAGNERWQNAISNAFPLRPLALATHTQQGPH